MYKKSSQSVDNLSNIVSKHDEDISELKSITKFFIIVVAATLVATLVGLGGLYISAFKEKVNSQNRGSQDSSDLKNRFEENQKQLSDLQLRIELIKAKNPYLK